jgi:hypothetical protein
MKQRHKRRLRFLRAALAAFSFDWAVDWLAEALWPWCSRSWRFVDVGR